MNIVERKFFKKYLSKFDENPFLVRFNDGDSFVIGEGEPKFEIMINGSIPKSDLLTSTSLALGEAYMRGDLEEKGDLYTTLNFFMGQMNKFTIDHKILKNLIHPSVSAKAQKKEVQYHYDIGNDFYSLWLDKTMCYSCGYFKNENDTLYDAQVNKVHLILSKLNLEEGMTLLDIGCGWGFLLIEAAKKYKIHGAGITLSEEQAKKFQQRIKEENLENYLEVKLMDYRELHKLDRRFDRIVSIGMLEHVGREHYELFIKNVNSVLKQSGILLLHYISGLKESAGDPWIKKYIFPGGVIPSLREMINICSEYGYYTVDVESLRRHYKKTLLCWNENFQNNLDKIREKFDDKFIRMWELYLCSCAASFNNGVIDLHQIVFTKGVNNDLPMTRDYLYK
ncbi:cyclopropane-fatty-acyl-phospholipid synthase [Clostridium homopropionicum DSM 5847]|uniref:Cyclopropane-fatty-acyl-phospholipid synthase n=1 Tax=Clostridium homopropionicum DSM 5847 TaxID=1121318 RepID=A0A0L6Z8I5_9CLOT|nr:cyclopropane-fatty-acyl-phospholipid synthase family protein [Clostridium homopropionicum]KOA19280.1 cyclopropane-fatty-acyl-phospholipid synthase [Clostridium homopropionicum DSM 5847]SFG19616.1 cyclopropane-fatty-acyl-phospholipid synthase [Clostridium homopropionicum]